MNEQDIVDLAACAGKSSQEAKRAEAHAKACRVYAKKAEKDAKEAQAVATRLIVFAREVLLSVLDNKTDITDIPLEDLQALVEIANIEDPLKTALSFHSVFSCENIPPNSDKVPLTTKEFYDNELDNVEKGLKNSSISNPLDQIHDPGSNNDADLSKVCLPSCGNNQLSQNVLGPISANLHGTQQIGVATKRKTKRRRKTSAVGLPSPLLSQEDVTVFKKTTSPSPSQHSGLSGTQHKYSVRKRRSTSSLQTITDDCEMCCSSRYSTPTPET